MKLAEKEVFDQMEASNTAGSKGSLPEDEGGCWIGLHSFLMQGRPLLRLHTRSNMLEPVSDTLCS